MSKALGAALAQHLKNDAGISAIVSTRIFHGLSPTTAQLPRITLVETTARHDRHMGGASGLAQYVWAIECWAATALDSLNLADAVTDAIDNFDGVLGSGANVVTTRGVFMDSQFQDFVAPSDASQSATHVTRQNARFWIEE